MRLKLRVFLTAPSCARMIPSEIFFFLWLKSHEYTYSLASHTIDLILLQFTEYMDMLFSRLL